MLSQGNNGMAVLFSKPKKIRIAKKSPPTMEANGDCFT
jgi:hypothetical protein